MATREGKALSFVRVPSNYAGGIQEGDPTPVYIDPDGGSGIPPVDPATAGNLVVLLADGTLEDAGYAADVNATAGSVVRRDTNGRVRITGTGGGEPVLNVQSPAANTSAIAGQSTDGTGVSATSSTGTAAISVTTSGTYHHEFGAVSAIARTTGALTFLGASAAANRNAQLAELFASIPTSPGAVGTLWNDGGTIKIVV